MTRLLDSKKTILAVFFVAVLGVTGGVLFWGGPLLQKSSSARVLVDYGAVPVFSLTDHLGQAFNSSSLNGRPAIVSFLFTRCQGQCPIIVARLHKLSAGLPGVHFVSLTSDPEHDTPEVLNQYKGSRPGPEDWTLLSGDKETIARVTNSFKLSAPENPQLHSTRFVLLDHEGHIRGFYDSAEDQDMGLLAQDAKVLLRRSGEREAL